MSVSGTGGDVIVQPGLGSLSYTENYCWNPLEVNGKGYVIREVSGGIYFSPSQIMDRMYLNGLEVFKTIDDAKNKIKKLFESPYKRFYSPIGSSGFGSPGMGSFYEYEIIEVTFPNCWLYDTEPMDDGSRFKLKISPPSSEVIIKHDGSEFKDLRERSGREVRSVNVVTR